jgi:peptidoglycan/LPS O-acetylase OafA/YrhL
VGQRLAGLDGLRALSIGLVVAMHFSLTGTLAYPLNPAHLGRQGVCLFFVLSGFLITRVLLEGGALLRFYQRRALRIFPAFYFYLTTVLLLQAMAVYTIAPLSMVAAATYWMNWYPYGREWPLQHTWSLAVEEQFYLSWPLALRVLGPARAFPFLVGVLALWPLQRWLRSGHWGHPSTQEALFAATYDSIIWGCLAALVCHRGSLRLPFPWLPALLLGSLLAIPEGFPTVLIPPARGLALAWGVAWICQNQGHALVRGLELAPLVWLGQRSYSLYLWHLLFCDPRWGPRLGGPLALGLALLASELSYVWLERPVLAWRNRRWPAVDVE